MRDSGATPRIEYLADHMGHAALLGRWHFAEWASLFPAWSERAAIAELQGHDERRRMPTTLVALCAEQVVGSVSLVADDLPEWPHYTPWLASLLVHADQRGRGVGTALIERLIEEATALDIPALYLFTTGGEGLYSRFGWQGVERITYHGHPGTIMRRVVSPAAAAR